VLDGLVQSNESSFVLWEPLARANPPTQMNAADWNRRLDQFDASCIGTMDLKTRAKVLVTLASLGSSGWESSAYQAWSNWFTEHPSALIEAHQLLLLSACLRRGNKASLEPRFKQMWPFIVAYEGLYVPEGNALRGLANCLRVAQLELSPSMLSPLTHDLILHLRPISSAGELKAVDHMLSFMKRDEAIGCWQRVCALTRPDGLPLAYAVDIGERLLGGGDTAWRKAAANEAWRIAELVRLTAENTEELAIKLIEATRS